MVFFHICHTQVVVNQVVIIIMTKMTKKKVIKKIDKKYCIEKYKNLKKNIEKYKN